VFAVRPRPISRHVNPDFKFVALGTANYVLLSKRARVDHFVNEIEASLGRRELNCYVSNGSKLFSNSGPGSLIPGLVSSSPSTSSLGPGSLRGRDLSKDRPVPLPTVPIQNWDSRTLGHPQNYCAQPSPRGDRLSGVAAMLVVAVVSPLGSAGPWCATMHPAAPSPIHRGRPAWRS
jgi:hypothetical protein